MKFFPVRIAKQVAAWSLTLAAGFNLAGVAATRTTTTPVVGLRDASPRVHALVGGRIVMAPGKVIERGTLVLRDGVVAAVGPDVAVPADARVWDVTGCTLYPGFIESHSSLLLPEALRPPGATARAEGAERPRPAAPAMPVVGARAANPRIMPEKDVLNQLTPDPKGVEKFRALGFTVANIAPERGIFRGSSALVSLGTWDVNSSVVRAAADQEVVFEIGSYESFTYPTSLMGAIALIRQTLLDAQWYAATQAAYANHAGQGVERPEVNESLAALGPVVAGRQLAMFQLDDELDAARVLRLADEFKLKVALRGVGTEYRVRQELARAKVPVVIPLDFPEAPEVESPDRAVDVQLHELEQWDLAPSNAARLAEAGVTFAFTTSRLRKPETEFWPRLRRAVRRGLTEDQALAALTTVPAAIFGISATQGTLDVGHAGNVVVARGDLFKADDAVIELVWVDGDPYEQEAWQRLDLSGAWQVTWTGVKGPAELAISGRGGRLRVKAGEKSGSASQPDRRSVLMQLPAEVFGSASLTTSGSTSLTAGGSTGLTTGGTARLAASGEGDDLSGTGELPDGTSFRWTAHRSAAAKAEEPAATRDEPIATGDRYPAGAFGRKGPPAQPEHVLITHGTVWTSGPAGVIEDGDVLIERGRIVQVGRKLVAPAGALVIDARGKHVTAGIIDCHSHIAISRGVNEGGSAVSLEVRIGDVIDPTDISLYRDLAGGTTVLNILHGSANPMGGQNQVIKIRWGEDAEGLKFAGAKPGVKFALGENVVRAHSLAPVRTRYPVSRMGVPEIMHDVFNRAREYERTWADYRAGRSVLPPRRDLRLEAALEILNRDRIIHIHSYRSDEVLTFIRLADQLHLPVATFQHILEGYKVAPEIAKLGAGGSTFADWWAYKFEVYDGIPYNGALMARAGIVVSYNSDSADLSRRLNTEAAKAVKYGGVSPVNALDFVTINPARQLQIDQRVGSLEPGKAADFVIWNGSPLSTMAHPEQTWIDGRKYFDRDDDLRMRAEAAAERSALLQKALAERRKAVARGPAAESAGDSSDGGGPKPPGAATDDHDEYRAIYHNGADAHTCMQEEGGLQ
ncbi:MAG: amidohydrolase family protein [Verrucomicrobia bacterium]|nr:amidohydrolase family protein [Verrucomicrobiota bacterium]